MLRREMAKQTNLPYTTIRRIYAAFGSQPHRIKSFNSADSLKAEPLSLLVIDKAHDAIGLH